MIVAPIRHALLLSLLGAGGCAGRTPIPQPPEPESEPGSGLPEFVDRTDVDPDTGRVVREWTEYRNGKGPTQRHGREVERWPDGSMRAERVFAFGEPAGHSREWYEGGTLRLDILFAGPDVATVMRFYHPNGRISAEGEGRDSVRTGPWTFYYENGRVSKQGEYAASLRTGEWTLWFPNGGLKSRGVFDRDRRVGTWRHWRETPPTFGSDDPQ